MKIEHNVRELLLPWYPALDMESVSLQHRGPVCWFVASVLHQGALTFAPFVVFGRHRYDGSRVSSVALLAHELKHIEQYRSFGHLGFLRRYAWDLAKAKFRYSRDLPLEAEAYALQDGVRAALQGEPC